MKFGGKSSLFLYKAVGKLYKATLAHCPAHRGASDVYRVPERSPDTGPVTVKGQEP